MLLTRIQIEPIVRRALIEDLGGLGDLTSQAVISANRKAKAVILAKQKGCLAGLDIAKTCFDLLDRDLLWVQKQEDGAWLEKGDIIAEISGSALSLLAGERVALNFLTHCSGIATATALMTAKISSIAPHIKIYCTRKTTPNLRCFEKYAVKCGGGYNHRFGLSDGILIKDNHLALTSIGEAVARVRQKIGHLTKIEVEADHINQIDDIIASGADAVLLDNFSAKAVKEAVELIQGRLLIDVSGKITPDNIIDYAQKGVDVISSGWMTHSAQGLDISLDINGIK